MDTEGCARVKNSYIRFGAHGAGETPVPIPNTEVKPSSGDYTAFSGKLARCRIIQLALPNGRAFVFVYKTKVDFTFLVFSKRVEWGYNRGNHP